MKITKKDLENLSEGDVLELSFSEVDTPCLFYFYFFNEKLNTVNIKTQRDSDRCSTIGIGSYYSIKIYKEFIGDSQ